MLRSYKIMAPVIILTLLTLYLVAPILNLPSDWQDVISCLKIFVPIEFFRFAFASVEDASAIAQLTKYRMSWEYSLLIFQCIALLIAWYFNVNYYYGIIAVMFVRFSWYVLDFKYIYKLANF